MKYISTRGNVSEIGFIDAVLMGLANDGGLLIPEEDPTNSCRKATGNVPVELSGISIRNYFLLCRW